MNDISKKMKDLIKARQPLIYLKTAEELEALQKRYEILDNECQIFLFDEAEGIRWKNEDTLIKQDKDDNKQLLIRIKSQRETIGNDFQKALLFIRDISKDQNVILIILSSDNLLKNEDLSCSMNIRALKNVVNSIKEGNLASLFLVSTYITIPPILEKDTIIIEFEYPNREQINVIFDNFIRNNELSVGENLKNEIISSLQGLTNSEIENLLYIAISNDGVLDEKDIDLFIDYKKQIVKKNSIIEFVDLRSISTNMGGLKTLKKWLERKKEIFKNLDRAINEGVDMPKGVLLVGMPGCGKSLAAKYTGKLMNLPLLRLDMGRIMGQYLGQSEENIRKAILTAESIAPSILWIDEIEKALSGIKDSNNDTLTRIFGTLLTWMQEKTKAVFVISTANDITGLPPEFLRKGRFDEIFFVDFPDKNSIKEIFKIHLEKRKKDPSGINLDKIVDLLEYGYSGADIEAIVSETVERTFIDGRKQLTTDNILQTIRESNIKPMSKSLGDKVEALKKTFKKYALQKAD